MNKNCKAGSCHNNDFHNENGPQGHLGNKQLVRSMWRRLMDSTNNKISCGAEHINRCISRARGENWRRTNPKK